MILDEDMTQILRKELKEKLNEKNLEGLNGVVKKINNEKNKLVVGLWITSQNYEVITGHKRK